MSRGQPLPEAAPRERDRPAVTAWRIGWVGTVLLGGTLAVLQAVTGAGGRAGLAALLLGALLSCAAGALYAVISGAVDSIRGRAVGRQRVVAAAVLGVLALLLPAMVIGASASA